MSSVAQAAASGAGHLAVLRESDRRRDSSVAPTAVGRMRQHPLATKGLTTELRHLKAESCKSQAATPGALATSLYRHQFGLVRQLVGVDVCWWWFPAQTHGQKWRPLLQSMEEEKSPSRLGVILQQQERSLKYSYHVCPTSRACWVRAYECGSSADHPSHAPRGGRMASAMSAQTSGVF